LTQLDSFVHYVLNGHTATVHNTPLFNNVTPSSVTGSNVSLFRVKLFEHRREKDNFNKS